MSCLETREDVNVEKTSLSVMPVRRVVCESNQSRQRVIHGSKPRIYGPERCSIRELLLLDSFSHGINRAILQHHDPKVVEGNDSEDWEDQDRHSALHGCFRIRTGFLVSEWALSY